MNSLDKLINQTFLGENNKKKKQMTFSKELKLDCANFGSPMWTRDKVNLKCKSGCKPHLTSQFYKLELGLKFTS